MRKGKNERVSLKEIRGFCSEKITGAMQELDAIGNASACENYVYHASINPAFSDHLTPEQMLQAVDILERHLKLENHQRVIVSHEKEGREHYHIAWNRLDPETMTAVKMSHNYRAHEEAAREIERTFSLEHTQGRHTEGGPKPERGPKQWESDRGRRSGLDPNDISAEVSEVWRSTETAEAFRAEIEARGYLLAVGKSRAFLLVDQNGDPHALARRAKVKGGEVKERFASLNSESLPTLEDARATLGERSAEADRQKALEKSFGAFQRAKLQKMVNDNEGFLDLSIAAQDQGFDLAANKYGHLVAVAESGFSYRVKATAAQSAELKELQADGLILPNIEAIREERKAARAAKKAEREEARAKRESRRAEYEKRKEKRTAHLGATLYDRGDMASQQQDALLHVKDRDKIKEGAARAQQHEKLKQDKAEAAKKDREERAKAAQAQKPQQRGEQSDRKQRYSQSQIMQDLFRKQFSLPKERTDQSRENSNDWDRERER